jgi:hypothetical protein
MRGTGTLEFHSHVSPLPTKRATAACVNAMNQSLKNVNIVPKPLKATSGTVWA